MLVFATHATGGGVNHDLIEGYTWKRVNYPRLLTGIGHCGSTAAFDCSVNIFVNGVKMAESPNLAAGGPTKDHIIPVNIPVPSNALLEVLVVTDSTTNAFNFLFEFME